MTSKQNNRSEGDNPSFKSGSNIGEAWNIKKKKKRHDAGDEITTIHSSDEDDKGEVDVKESIHEEEPSEQVTVLDKDSDHEYSHTPKTERRTHASDDDSENQHFIKIQELNRLPRIEPNSRGNYIGSFHRYEKPISNFKLRVSLLKYPSLTQRREWGDNLLVLEDRVLSWQEKIFSKTEVGYLMNKSNVFTSLDEKYRTEILTNKDSIGKYFYTYVESDSYTEKLNQRNIIRRCPALHSRKSRKFNSGTADKSINSDGESVVDEPSDGDEFQRSILPKKSILASQGSLREILSPKAGTSGSTEKPSEEALKTLRKKKEEERHQKEKQLKKDAAEKARMEREEKLKKEKEIKEAIKKGRKELKADLKQKRFKELEKRKKEKDDEYMKMWAGSKRPSLALEAHMKLGMTPTRTPKLKKKRKQKEGLEKQKGKSFDSETNGEDEGEWNTQDEENESDGDYSRKEAKHRKKRKPLRRKSSDKDISLEEILEPPSSRKPRRKETQPKQPNVKESSEPVDLETLVEKDKKEKSSIIQTGYKYSHSRAVRSRSRPVWKLGSRSTSKGLSSMVEYPQSMIIKVAIPHMTKKRRDLTVCVAKVYMNSGAVCLKPSFGYRIIEAKRNHVYRVSWELYSDTPSKGKHFTKTRKDIKRLEETDENVLRKEELKGLELKVPLPKF